MVGIAGCFKEERRIHCVRRLRSEVMHDAATETSKSESMGKINDVLRRETST